MENKEKKHNGMAYRFMRLEIQALIMKCLKVADSQMRDVDLKKLSADIQYKYGVGELTVSRIIDTMAELKILKIDNGHIKRVIKGKD